MREIDNSNERASSINRVMDEVVFQTNLLALHTAVQTACAAGNTAEFAMVAATVRNLAARGAGVAAGAPAPVAVSLAEKHLLPQRRFLLETEEPGI